MLTLNDTAREPRISRQASGVTIPPRIHGAKAKMAMISRTVLDKTDGRRHGNRRDRDGRILALIRG
ncbi:MAG: hypothetical protein U1F68_20290 [Gammaproteobacteria bacterium]